MVDLLDTCIPYLEVLERVLISAFDVTCDLTMNPEFHLEEISPVSMDFLCGSTIIRMCGEKKPDYYMWVESWLMAYTCFACTNENIKRIQIMHPFHGLLWEFNSIDLVKAKILYEVLLKLWSVKQS
jgi:hypothetical protein